MTMPTKDELKEGEALVHVHVRPNGDVSFEMEGRYGPPTFWSVSRLLQLIGDSMWMEQQAQRQMMLQRVEGLQGPLPDLSKLRT